MRDDRQTVKKWLTFQYNHYADLQQKLEKFASEGLFLEKIGAYRWTFRKGEPKNVHYTVTFFAKASVFSPKPSDEQETYYDYAEATGWNFVSEYGQMQIFMSEDENPVPFDTDESEKLKNIKRCMNRTMLPTYVGVMLIFIMSLVSQCKYYAVNPINYLSSATNLYSVLMYIIVIALYSTQLMSYFVWCRKSAKSIALGGTCIERNNRLYYTVKRGFTYLCLLMILAMIFAMTSQIGMKFALISVAQVPIVIVAFQVVLRGMKKMTDSTMLVRVVCIAVTLAVSFGYIGGLSYFIVKYDFLHETSRAYRTVTVQLSENYDMDYEIFSDEIPLVVADLYPDAEHPDYSYEKEIDSTLFMKSTSYSQSLYPMRDKPPEISYDIIECKYDWVFDTAMEYLLRTYDWADFSWHKIDSAPFNADLAYARYYDGEQTGGYYLCYGDTIVSLYLDEKLTDEDREIVLNKLNLA